MSSVPLSQGRASTLAPNAADVDATYRKITWRLIPFIDLLWLLAWIDRINVGYVKLTMLADLQWSETVYGLGAGIFFLGYFFFEVPSNLLLQKIGARKTLMRITIGWGLTAKSRRCYQLRRSGCSFRFMPTSCAAARSTISR